MPITELPPETIPRSEQDLLYSILLGLGGGTSGVTKLPDSMVPRSKQDLLYSILLATASIGGGGGGGLTIASQADAVAGTNNTDAMTPLRTSQRITAVFGTPSAVGLTLLQAADAAAQRTAIGLVIGTNVQAFSANLSTYAGITPSANVQTLLGAADFAAFKTSLSLNSVENTALSTWAGTSNITTLGTIATGVWSGTTIGASKGGTGLNTSASTGFPKIASGTWSVEDASTHRTSIGLGTIATQAASAVAITGGTATGLTNLGISMANNTAMTGFALGTISDTTSRPFNISQAWNNASLTGGVLDVAATVTAAGASSYIQRWLGGAAGATTRMILRNDGLLCFNALATGGAMAIKPVTSNAQLFFLRMDGSGASDGSGAGGIYQESGYGVNGFTVAANYGYGFAANNAGSAFVTAAANDTFITRRAAGSLVFGKLESTTPVAQFLSAHDVTTGTGSALTLSGGRGSVAGGALNLATSATNGAPVTHLSISSAGTIDFASAALTTETVVSNRTLTVKVGGATVKICCFV